MRIQDEVKVAIVQINMKENMQNLKQDREKGYPYDCLDLVISFVDEIITNRLNVGIIRL